jgi:arylsulfatase A-like enzyme
MPNVQALLVANGVTFSEAFAVDSLCCPSRASILSGQYAHTTGVYSNVNGFQKFDDVSTIATWLHDAGYRTGLVGKYLNGYDETRTAYILPGGIDGWPHHQTGQASTWRLHASA